MPTETEHQCKIRQKRQGIKLASANKQCAGTPNKQGQFYRCIKRKLKIMFEK